MRTVKKFIFVAVSLFIIMSVFCKTVAAKNIARISASDVNGNLGETVTLSVVLSNNPGLAAIRLKMIYDKSVLKLEKVTNGKVFKEGSELFGKNKADVPYYMLWEDALSETNNEKNGQLVELVFKISESTKASETVVEIEVDNESTFDKDLNNVTVEGGKATVNIVREVTAALNGKNSGTASQANEKNTSDVEEIKAVTQSAPDTTKNDSKSIEEDASITDTPPIHNESKRNNTPKTLLVLIPILIVSVLTIGLVIKRKGANSNEK